MAFSEIPQILLFVVLCRTQTYKKMVQYRNEFESSRRLFLYHIDPDF